MYLNWTHTGGARRSNVVNEVERLKKNREERRAKQKEIMEEKVAQKNVDPGNPNWEFLTMIREYQEQVEFNPLQDGDAVVDHQVRVTPQFVIFISSFFLKQVCTVFAGTFFNCWTAIKKTEMMDTFLKKLI